MQTLRHSGVRIEELLELSQLSIRQYRRPNGEVIALLVVAPSKTDRERVIPVSAELFTVIAAIIRRHTRGSGKVPVVPRYDPHERETSPPQPYLFQRRGHIGSAVIAPATVVRALQRLCTRIAETDPVFSGTVFTPHDFRRILATELVNGGLPIHIGAALLGHLNVQTTRGYVAVFDEDVVRHYQEFLHRRRARRPPAEYRAVTGGEWAEFEEHFDRARSNSVTAPGLTEPDASTSTPACAARSCNSTRRCYRDWRKSKRTCWSGALGQKQETGWARSRAST